MQLGEWIKAYRKEQGLSMQNFADLCGFSKAYIGQLEKGINPKTNRPMSPTMQTFTKIASSVGLSVDQLLERLDADQPVSVNKKEPPAPAGRPAASESARERRDERDVQRRLESIREDLANADGLAFMHGEQMTEEDRELLLDAIESGLRTAKRLAKKYTPKKYREDGK